VTDLQIRGIGTKEVNRLQYDFLLARYLKRPEMVDGPLHHFAKCHFGGLFKYGRRYVSKMVKFRKISITYDKINLSTCKWAQIVPLKILYLLIFWYAVCKDFCMLATRVLQINERKLNFEGILLLVSISFLFPLAKSLFSSSVCLALQRRL